MSGWLSRISKSVLTAIHDAVAVWGRINRANLTTNVLNGCSIGFESGQLEGPGHT